MAWLWNLVVSREQRGVPGDVNLRHGFKVSVGLLGDLVREFAASYLDT